MMSIKAGDGHSHLINITVCETRVIKASDDTKWTKVVEWEQN